MNTLTTFHCALAALGIASVSLMLFIAIWDRYHKEIREHIAMLFRPGPMSWVVVVLGVAVFTAYAGTKHPSSTNEPPSGIGGDAPSTTNEPPTDIEGDPAPTNTPPPMMMMGRSRPMMSPPPELTANNQQLTTNVPWHVRGAFCDWVPIMFLDGFEFPYGTNMLNGVTLMAYGELRENLHCSPSPSTFTLNLPQPVSIEPGVSLVCYGLTPSNSFLFSWQNVCVNRDPTNRVDASIELFDSGAIATTVTPLSTPTPPTYTYIPPTPPEGFVGVGQDDDWLANAFPSQFAAITNGGYNAWLTDHIGHNEPNGRYKLSVTVSSLPDHGPCYLVCGPYKMIVTSPGTYSFPLIDMTEYDLYTCPIAVPLTWEMDDGWDPPEPSYQPLFMSPAPRMLGAPRNDDNHYKPVHFPEVWVRPNYVTREEAMREAIELRCNASGIASRDYSSYSGQAVVRYVDHSEAVLEECNLQDDIFFHYDYNGMRVTGVLYVSPIYYPWWWHDPDPTNGNSNASSTNDNSSASNP